MAGLHDLVRQYIAALEAERAANAEFNERLKLGPIVITIPGPPSESATLLKELRKITKDSDR